MFLVNTQSYSLVKKKSSRGRVKQVIVGVPKVSSPKLLVSPPSPWLDEDGLEIIALTLYTLNVFNKKKKKLNVHLSVIFLFFFSINFFLSVFWCCHLCIYWFQMVGSQKLLFDRRHCQVEKVAWIGWCHFSSTQTTLQLHLFFSFVYRKQCSNQHYISNGYVLSP